MPLISAKVFLMIKQRIQRGMFKVHVAWSMKDNRICLKELDRIVNKDVHSAARTSVTLVLGLWYYRSSPFT